MKIIQHTKLVIALSLGIAGMAMAEVVPQELVDGLGAESYQLREKSEIELAKWAKEKGEKGLDVLSELKQKAKSPEVKSRLDNVISGIVIFKAIPNTRGYMGLMLTPEIGAVGILRVVPDSPAARSGLQAGDKITGLDAIDLSDKDNRVHEAMTFVQWYVKTKKAGEKLTLKVERDDKKMIIILKLADYDKKIARMNGFDNGGGIQILPMQGGGFQRNFKVIPPRANRNLNLKQLMENEKELLELNLKHQQQMLEKAELPDEFKEMFRQQQMKNKKRLELLKLKEKKDLKK